jgi:serine/threonine-protein phosphatase PP1 catalytic subunit
LEITNQSIPIDLLWSDPEPFATGWQENERGVSYTFGMDSVVNFLRDNHLEMIVRSHQLVELGYEFLFNKMLCTLFSVPDFLGEYDNFGAIMVVEEALKCSFELTKPKNNPRVKYIDKPAFKK